MAAWDEDELALAVLQHLGIVGVGQTAEPEDSTLIKTAWTSEHKGLRRHGLAPFAVGSIDDEYQQPLVKYMCGEVYGYFGITGERRAMIIELARKGYEDLQEQAGGDRSSLPVQGDYF